MAKIVMTEDNCLDIYKKLSNNNNISPEELIKVKERFYELVNYKIK